MYMYFDLMPQSVEAQEVVTCTFWFLFTSYQLGSTKSSVPNQFGSKIDFCSLLIILHLHKLVTNIALDTGLYIQ